MQPARFNALRRKERLSFPLQLIRRRDDRLLRRRLGAKNFAAV
jgi:hypothetical protein